MTGHNIVHLAIQFWKLEVKKLYDWAVCVCDIFNKILKLVISRIMKAISYIQLYIVFWILIDVMHTKCLMSHIQNFPTQTAPAGYVCASCSSPVSLTQSPSACMDLYISIAATLRISQLFDLKYNFLTDMAALKH
jgi:hypothetical protein